jgi:dethiobiotin synthetase
MKLPDAFFVTGTDTNVGKTVVSAILTSGLRAHYWKPVQSGVLEGTDSKFVAGLTGLPDSHFLPETYLLQEPLSPHEAARIDGISISLNNINLPDSRIRPLVVEGAGGVMVPLNGQHLMLDLMKHLALPAVIVARSSLGTINHTLLTLHALRSRAIPVLGIVMNGEKNPANRRAIEIYGQTSVLAEIPWLPTLNQETITQAFSYFSVSPTLPEGSLACQTTAKS